MSARTETPMPPQIERLPLDDRGYPIPFVAQRWDHMLIPPPKDPRFGDVAVPDRNQGQRLQLGFMDEQRQRACFLAPKCQVCNRRLGAWQPRDMGDWQNGEPIPWGDRPGFLIGGFDADGRMPLDKFHFREPWVCTGCAEFAVQVCPGLLRGRHGQRLGVVLPARIEIMQERITVKEIAAVLAARHGTKIGSAPLKGDVDDGTVALAMPLDYNPDAIGDPPSVLMYLRVKSLEHEWTGRAEDFLAEIAAGRWGRW